MMNIVSTLESRRQFSAAIWNSRSKSVIARKPLTMTGAPTSSANSTNSVSKARTDTLERCEVAASMSAILSSVVNSGPPAMIFLPASLMKKWYSMQPLKLPAGVMIGLTASGWAEEADAGKAEYLKSCAPCHGTDGKGTGPLSSRLKTKPADLTNFAKKNNGVFPVSTVYDAIDGRNAVASHGIREMPIWGDRFNPIVNLPHYVDPSYWKMAGPEQNGTNSNWRYLYDLCATWKAAPALTLGLNADYGHEWSAPEPGRRGNWDGVALYGTYAFTDRFNDTDTLMTEDGR